MSCSGVPGVYGNYETTKQILMDSPISSIVCSSRVTKSLYHVAVIDILSKLSANFRYISTCANKYTFTIRPTLNELKTMTISDILTLLSEVEVSPTTFTFGRADLTAKLKAKKIKCVFEDLIVKKCFDVVHEKASQKAKEIQIISQKDGDNQEEIMRILAQSSESDIEFLELLADSVFCDLFENSFVKIMSQQLLANYQVLKKNGYDSEISNMIRYSMISLVPMFSNECNHRALIKIAQFAYKEVYIPYMSKLLGTEIPEPVLDSEIEEFKTVNEFITNNQISGCNLFTTEQYVKDLIEYRNSKVKTP